MEEQKKKQRSSDRTSALEFFNRLVDRLSIVEDEIQNFTDDNLYALSAQSVKFNYLVDERNRLNCIINYLRVAFPDEIQ